MLINTLLLQIFISGKINTSNLEDFDIYIQLILKGKLMNNSPKKYYYDTMIKGSFV